MNAREELTDLLRQKKSEQEEAVDWKVVKKNWIHSLSALMRQIEEWVEPLVREKLIKIKETKIKLTEEYFGTYNVTSLTITAAPHVVEIRPAARVIIGAKGRVDMINGAKKIMLLVNEKDQWRIAVRAQKIRTLPLNEESFLGALKELLQ